MSQTAAPIDITFTEAYEQLKEITTRLNGADRIAPDELIELLMRGKGLDRVLRGRLDEVEQKVKAIEGGDDFTAYRIVPDHDEAPDRDESPNGDAPAPGAPPPSAPAPSDDELPF